MKNRAARASVAAGGEYRALQSDVWAEVDHKSTRMGAQSPTGAMHDIFESHRGALDAYRRAVVLKDGQIGALAAIGGRFMVLDHVSRPDVFAALHAPLVQGYALDAIEARARPAPSVHDAEVWLGRVLASRVTQRDGIGLGRDVRFTEAGLGGSGLVAGDELVQLTAFAEDESEDGPRAGRGAVGGRIRRPSRRHRT